jgi:hypothetical protein
MKSISFIKGITLTAGIIIFSLSASAQKIEEKDLKVNIASITNPVERLAALQPIKFNYNLDKYSKVDFPSNAQYGFETNSVSQKFPELIKSNAKSYPAGKNQFKYISFDDVDEVSLIPVLVAAIKEQQQQIDALKAEVEKLKAK